MEIEVEISSKGEDTLEQPQQSWSFVAEGTEEIALFAGQEMVVTRRNGTDPDTYELHYLGLVGTSFESREAAKEFAPEFAKEVLRILSSIVSPD